METEDRQLELQIGDALQLQFVTDENKRRHYSKVIGYLQGQSVLITTPRIDGSIMLVRKDQRVIVRMMSGNQVYGFTTSVISTNLNPYAYLHLAYPKDMEHITVRKAQRIHTSMIASVELENESTSEHIKKSAMVRDISTSGAMIDLDEQVGEVGDMLTMNAKINVAGMEEYINLACMIRNISHDAFSGRYRYGIEFQLLEQNEHFIIHGYVYEQMLKNMKNT